jgi:hypothetical protein
MDICVLHFRLCNNYLFAGLLSQANLAENILIVDFPIIKQTKNKTLNNVTIIVVN